MRFSDLRGVCFTLCCGVLRMLKQGSFQGLVQVEQFGRIATNHLLRPLHGISKVYRVLRISHSVDIQHLHNQNSRIAMPTKQTESTPSFLQVYTQVRRDRMKHSFLRQISACVDWRGIRTLLNKKYTKTQNATGNPAL